MKSIFILTLSTILFNPFNISMDNLMINDTLDKEKSISENLDQTENELSGFQFEEVEVCSTSSVKTYMSYSAVTDTRSKQYKIINNEMTVQENGLLVDEHGFIGVALGSYYGDLGSRYLITLENGETIPVIKVDAKSDSHTINGCYQMYDNSVIEFVIDVEKAGNHFGNGGNGLVVNGNFNNIEEFNGAITKIERVTIIEDEDELEDDEVEFEYEVIPHVELST